jgi:hypothetical protein
MWNPSMAECSIDVLSNLTDELMDDSSQSQTCEYSCIDNVCDKFTDENAADMSVADGAVFVDDEVWVEETLLPK